MPHESRDAHIDAGDMLWVDRQVDNHSVIVRAVGEVDLVSAPLLYSQLAMAEAVVVPPAPVVLDLEGVSFLGVKGLRVLLRHHQRCTDLGSRLEIFGGRVVSRVVAAAGVDQVLLVRSPAPST
jgi:anti-sigma B factor antagonist